MTDRIGPRGLKANASGIRTVLVFRALNLGDMLCAVPALRALRAGLPHARISLCGLPWARSFVRRFSRYLDEFIEFPGYPGLPERNCSGSDLNAFLRQMQDRRFDLAIQMHGSGSISNAVIESVGARFVAGFHPEGFPVRDRHLFAAYPASLPEVERNLSLIRLIGFSASDPELEFPFLPDDGLDLSASAELHAIPARTYACIHPGASSRTKCWPVAHFAAVASHLRQWGLTVVVTGNRHESDLAAAISELLQHDCIDAASLDLSLGSLALLIRDSRLLVCNDTGVSHIASALRVPSVVLFSTADPLRWAPRDCGLHRSLGGQGTIPSVPDVLAELRNLLAAEEYPSCQPAS